MTSKWVYQGKCIGYGIPYTTSMTSPETIQSPYGGNEYSEQMNVVPLA